ncbi:MAG: Fe-S cluster assembly ATPase SufC [Mycoplasma sp.]|nr:Fe-S cluster assembly ATPase SufC [Mycoplasma sp.]
MIDKLIAKKINISIDSKPILNNISFSLKTGDVVALIGPNGAGKTTLLKSLVNHYSTKINSGDILFNNKSIKNMETYKIARMGFFYVDQNPPQLNGVPMLEFLKDIIKINSSNSSFYQKYKMIDTLFDQVSLDKSLLSHSVNVGFSGGQKKKNEIIQSALLNSKVLLLDELDAGLDIDAIKIVQDYINKNRKSHITIMITHDLDMFSNIKPNKVFLLANHKIQKTGGLEIIDEINKNGYKNYEQKPKRQIDSYRF